MENKLKVAFLGSGKIAIDLLIKAQRSKYLRCVLVASRNLQSEGLVYAKSLGVEISDNSIEGDDNYFNEVFSWLKKCEDLFGFELKGYNQIRMYTFLAERFLPYWFKKYKNYLEWPVVYCDINK